MATVAVLYVPSSKPLLSLSDALSFHVITVSEVWFWLPINDMYGLVIGMRTFSLQKHNQQKERCETKFSYCKKTHLQNVGDVLYLYFWQTSCSRETHTPTKIICNFHYPRSSFKFLPSPPKNTYCQTLQNLNMLLASVEKMETALCLTEAVFIRKRKEDEFIYLYRHTYIFLEECISCIFVCCDLEPCQLLLELS